MLIVLLYKIRMDEKFFLHPKDSWQCRYEALRALCVERLPAAVVVERFGFTTSYTEITVTFPRRPHNPILRNVPWQRLPQQVSWLGNRKLTFRFL